LVDRSNWLKRHGFTAKSLGRLVDSAIKLYKKNAVVAKATTGGEASAPANKVNERINRQTGYWSCSIDQVNMIISVIGGARPLVGGVQRGGRAFEGAPPDDAPEDVIDLVDAAADDNGDDIDGVENDEDEESFGGRADTSAARAGVVGGSSSASASAVAGGSSGGGGGSGATTTAAAAALRRRRNSPAGRVVAQCERRRPRMRSFPARWSSSSP